MMNRKTKPMHPSYVLQVLGVLIVLGGASGFVSRAASVKPRLPRLNALTARDRTGGKAKANTSSVATRRHKTAPSGSPQQTPWLTDLVTSWFNLPLPKLSSPSGTSRAKSSSRRYPSARDGIRAEILQLRASNAELREEVGALRKSMVDRGYMPVEDVFAVTTTAAPDGDKAGKNDPQRQQKSSSSKKPPAPPPKLPREARLAALVALYGAAVAVGGVFVPIAIGVGASRALRWMDEGGTMMPNRWRARGALGGGRGLRGKRWKDAVLSHVPVVARSWRGEGVVGGGDGAGGDGGAGDAGLMTPEALADAWDSMYPPRP